MLKLPWRKHFLVGKSHPPHRLPFPIPNAEILTPTTGYDLHGNTFWEFRPTLSTTTRLRRIVRPHNPALPVADLSISPQWHQWLRYTRPHAPTLLEQKAEVGRQENMKMLAREADERWASKPSLLDRPREEESAEARKEGSGEERVEGTGGEDIGKRHEEAEKAEGRPSGPGEGWQPEAWTPRPRGAMRSTNRSDA